MISSSKGYEIHNTTPAELSIGSGSPILGSITGGGSMLSNSSMTRVTLYLYHVLIRDNP